MRRRRAGGGPALEGLGHVVEESYPSALDDGDYVPMFLVRWTAGVAWNLAYWGRRIGRDPTEADVEPLTWALAEQGRTHSAATYLHAVEYAQAASRRIASWWADDGYDLLLTPTTAEPSTRAGRVRRAARQPGAADHPRGAARDVHARASTRRASRRSRCRCTARRTVCPVGVQLVAAFGREDLLLRVAAQLEQALPWPEVAPAGS